MITPRRILIFLSLLLLACGRAPEPGRLRLAIYGEDFIESGIPESEFADGWSVRFSRFVLALGEARVSGHEPGTGLDGSTVAPRGWLLDLAQPSAGAGQTIADVPLPGGDYPTLAFRIGPAAFGNAPGNARAEDKAALAASNASLWVSGTASKGGQQKTFSWLFTTDTRYVACAADARIDGGTARVEVTIHGDHLFYDDLVAAEPNLAFELVASADRDGDGDVTAAELAVTDISAQARYGTGSTGISNLWEFIAAQTRSLGHANGEGHCETAP